VQKEGKGVKKRRVSAVNCLSPEIKSVWCEKGGRTEEELFSGTIAKKIHSTKVLAGLNLEVKPNGRRTRAGGREEKKT